MPTFVRALGIIAAAAGMLFTLAAACEGNPNPPDDGLLRVRGQVVEVVPRSITEVEMLRLRDESGKEYVFVTEGFVGFTPSHLREHGLFGQPVAVTYRGDGRRLVAVRTED